MLTAKGYQAKNLLDSFSLWNRSTSKIRGKIAPGIPAWTFYLSVGTYGDKRNQVMVGQGNSQSPITPVGAWVPKEITEPVMESLFVGEDHAEAMAVYLESADEWLHAYDQKSGNGNGGSHSTPPATSYSGTSTEYLNQNMPSMDELPPMDDGNIPF